MENLCAKLNILSPLEAHKSNTIIFSMCGVDVGFDNPMYACLEIDSQDVERELNEDNVNADPRKHKLLTFYELDLGLNHVTRKCAEEVDPGLLYSKSIQIVSFMDDFKVLSLLD